ncbi:MAG: DUF5104 domain-containing protein [Ruminococcus sp.]|nr:DUF5104 domain-containing protein [Ruminococcus sp.]
MKRTVSILTSTALTMMIILSGCGETAKNTAKKADIVPQTYAIQRSTNITDYIINKNSTGLKGMFCQKIQDSGTLDSQISEAFSMIDGDIIGSGTPTGGLDNKETSGDDIVSLSIKGSATNIQTNTGKTYSMEFKEYYAYSGDEGYEGVTYIAITSNADNITMYIGDASL